MANWLRALARAILEYIGILILIGAAATASSFVRGGPGEEVFPLLPFFLAHALRLAPVAALATIFLCFFSFERRFRALWARWLNIAALGLVLMGGSFAAGAFVAPLVTAKFQHALAADAPASQRRSEANPAEPPSMTYPHLELPEIVFSRDSSLVWYSAPVAGTILHAAYVDFSADFPRLAYARNVPIERNMGYAVIQNKVVALRNLDSSTSFHFPLLDPRSPYWFHIRIPDAAKDSVAKAISMGIAFYLLILGFHIFTKISTWPLANFLFGGLAFSGLIMLDRLLYLPESLQVLQNGFHKLGIAYYHEFSAAALETALAIILIVLNLIFLKRHESHAHQ